MRIVKTDEINVVRTLDVQEEVEIKIGWNVPMNAAMVLMETCKFNEGMSF